jgi:hypothetical protein
LLSVVTRRLKPAVPAALVIVIVTPGTTAPLLSCVVISIVPVVSCANAAVATPSLRFFGVYSIIMDIDACVDFS